MAETLSEGLVIPSPGDLIPENGNEPTRTLGATANAAIAAKPDAAYVDARMFAKPRLASPVDLDTLKTPGTLDLPAPYPDGYTNIPPGNYTASKLVVYGSPGTTWAAQEIFQYGPNPRRWWRISSTISLWNPWIEVAASGGGGDSFSTNALALGGREMRMQLFRDAYPLVSTGGKGAVVFRYDHGLTNFKNVLKPIHDTYNVPAYIAMNSRTWGDEENSGATQAEARTWANVEWGNHTADHNDKTGIEDIWDNIVNGRIELEEQLGVTVHGFTMPGVTEHEKFDGLGTGSASGYSNTYAGALVMSHHAIASGVIGSAHRPLDGEIRVGGRHYTWERSAWADIKAQIDSAVTNKTALTLMCHPRTMGSTSGGSTYWDAALAEQVISYVRDRIDAGELADISYYQSHHAQVDPLPIADLDSGDLDITSTLAGITSGQVFLTRIGRQVWLDFQDVVVSEGGSFVQWNGAIPTGYRPPRAYVDLPLQGRTTSDTAGPARVSSGGQVIVYRPAGTIRGLVSWFTREAPPA